MSQLKLSARSYHRILKLARMIAALAGSEDIQSAFKTLPAPIWKYFPRMLIRSLRQLTT